MIYTEVRLIIKYIISIAVTSYVAYVGYGPLTWAWWSVAIPLNLLLFW